MLVVKVVWDVSEVMGLMEGVTLDVVDVMDEVRLVIYIYSCSSCDATSTFTSTLYVCYKFFHIYI